MVPKRILGLIELWQRVFGPRQPKISYGVSCDPSVQMPTDPSLPQYDQNLIFFRTRRDSGPFEIVSIDINQPNGPIYSIRCEGTGKIFKISRYWFEILFEEDPINKETIRGTSNEPGHS